MTNKTISLTIPNDDPIALHEFGAAMQRMAGRHGLEQAVPLYEQVSPSGIAEFQEAVVRALQSELGAEYARAAVHVPDGVDTDKAQLAALGEALAPVTATGEALDALTHIPVITEDERTALRDTTPSHLDSDGLPWDSRIHASSKERNADDTWRARRKPSDMDAGQWAEFQGQVRTELRALMELPVEQEVATVLDEQPVPDEPTPVVVEPVEPEPIVVTPPPVVAPPAPVEPVVPVAPPAPTGAGPTEFVPFLQWCTSNGHTPEQVNAALAQHGLTAVKQLQQRPDLIPQVHATLAAGV